MPEQAPQSTTVPSFILQKLALQGLEIDDLKFQVAHGNAQIDEYKIAVNSLNGQAALAAEEIAQLKKQNSDYCIENGDLKAKLAITPTT